MPEKSKGFGSLSREKQRDAASKGGKTPHEKGTPEEYEGGNKNRSSSYDRPSESGRPLPKNQ
jgi:Stress-induced bacterial acidophilic repeat motif